MKRLAYWWRLLWWWLKQPALGDLYTGPIVPDVKSRKIMYRRMRQSWRDRRPTL
jgi:hypothetical protein